VLTLIPTYLQRIEVEFPISQVINTDVTADDFIAHENAVNKFKDDFLAGIQPFGKN